MRVGSPEYFAFVRKLKTAEGGKIVLRKMTKEFRKQGRPVLNAVKQGALALPSKNVNARRGRPSLRRSLSKAAVMKIKLQKDAVMIVKIDGKKMPSGMRGLPPYIEGDARLRHPTFGDDPWVRQRPAPFFTQAVEKYKPRVEQGVQDVLNDLRDELES